MFISPRFRVLLLVAIILTLLVTIRRVFLKYPVIFYAPGLVFDIFKGTDPYTPIKWKESVVSSSSQPNIVFIIADDLGFNDLSGNTDVATPNIDSIAKSGATFTTAYAGHATCSPSRAAILTGRYATRMGFEYTAVPTSFAWVISRPQRGTLRDPVFHSDLIRNVPPMANMIVPLDEVMVSNVLKDLNYSTTYVGKWHLGESEGARPEQRGYEESLSFLQGASLYYPLNHPDVINAPLGSPLDDFLFGNLRHVIRFNGGRHFQPTAYMTDYLATEAANSIRDKCASPFFLTVAFNAPHNPLQASKEDFESPDIAHITDHTTRVYAAMIKALDRGVGTILTAIEECGKTENTLVVFTSDNGGPGTLGQVSNSINAPYRGWKATFFEGGIRVPLFMSWPRVIPRGSIYHKPVSHVDLFATAVVAGGVHNMTQLGLDLRRDYDGVNLLDFIGNFEVPDENISPAEVVPDTGVAPGSPALIYADGVDRAGKSPSPHQSLFWRSGHYTAMRSADLKIQVAERPDKVWLFDLVNDPTEQENLVPNLKWSDLKDLLRAEDYDRSSDRLINQGDNGTLPVGNRCGKLIEQCRGCLSTNHGSSVVIGGSGGREEEGGEESLTVGAATELESAANTMDNVCTGETEAVTVSSTKDCHRQTVQVGQHKRVMREMCALCMARALLCVNAEQAAPLWPALAEFPIPVDRTGMTITSLDDEYVLWPN